MVVVVVLKSSEVLFFSWIMRFPVSRSLRIGETGFEVGFDDVQRIPWRVFSSSRINVPFVVKVNVPF